MAASLHPFLASAPDAFTRLVRAHFYLVADMDFRHAAYWRDQIDMCEQSLKADVTARCGKPESADQVYRCISRNAICAGYAQANRVSLRSVVVPC